MGILESMWPEAVQGLKLNAGVGRICVKTRGLQQDGTERKIKRTEVVMNFKLESDMNSDVLEQQQQTRKRANEECRDHSNPSRCEEARETADPEDFRIPLKRMDKWKLMHTTTSEQWIRWRLYYGRVKSRVIGPVRMGADHNPDVDIPFPVKRL